MHSPNGPLTSQECYSDSVPVFKYESCTMSNRTSYEDSCRVLQERGFIDGDTQPRIPERMPRFDDDEALGVSFFRTGVWDDDLSKLTLPRTFFSRSEVSNISFKDSDLSESCMCWNNFVDVDFSLTDLARSDLRQSRFQGVRFVGANLTDADLRQSEFSDCDCSEAVMVRTKLSKRQFDMLILSARQVQDIDWHISDGDVPGGG